MRRLTGWTLGGLTALALAGCPTSTQPVCGAKGEPCCNSLVCSTGLVCLSSVCTVPGGGPGGGGGGSGSSGSSTRAGGGSSGGSSNGASNGTTSNSATTSSTLGGSSGGSSSSGSSGSLPGDTCSLCDTNPCNGATDDCVCDPDDAACTNGYCAPTCYAAALDGGEQSLCADGTECLEVFDATGAGGDDGLGDDWVCYPTSGSCIGVVGSSSSGGASSSATGGSSSSSGAASTSAPACGGISEPCCGSACNGGLVCQGGSCLQPAGGVTGTPCGKNGDCPTGICLPVKQPVGGQPAGESAWTGNVCTTSCTSVADCVSGWSCAALAGQPSDVCQCSYAPEICDGKDNDCDGIVDDEPEVDQACQGQLGGSAVCQGGGCVCGGGTLLCAAGSSPGGGVLSVGQPCASDAACSSDYCKSADGGSGVCTCNVARAGAPYPCQVPSDCCAGAVCVSNQCVAPGSGSSSSSGGGGSTCADPETSSANCGGCAGQGGVACPAAQSCVGGACACPAATPTFCTSSQTCVDTQSDASNCGICGQLCPAGGVCTQGSCGCPSGDTLCGKACVDTSSDPNNCGGCYELCEIAGATCDFGICTDAQQGQFSACPGPGSSCGSNGDCCGGDNCVGEGCPTICQGGLCICLPSGSCAESQICCSTGGACGDGSCP